MERSFALALVLVLALGGCASRPSLPSSGSAGEGARGGPPASSLDAGGPHACDRDEKDVAPCIEDCNRGIASACVEVASRLERGEGIARDLTRSVALHERACELREASSCITAARMHAAGSGVPPSRTRQVELLSAACRLGDPFACTVPAKAFANGAGVPRDPRRAKDLFERGCVGGVESACEAVEDAGP